MNDKFNESFYAKMLDIRLDVFQPNPYSPSNPNNELKLIDRKDCVVRSICKLTGKKWDEVYCEYLHLAYDLKAMWHSNYVTAKYLERIGFRRCEYVGRCTIGEFMYNHKEGRYLVANKDHIVCYMDGVIYDSCGCLNYVDSFITSKLNVYFTEEIITEKNCSARIIEKKGGKTNERY